MGNRYTQVILGVVLFVFGLMVFGGFFDWLVDLIGILTMVMGVALFAIGILSGQRARG